MSFNEYLNEYLDLGVVSVPANIEVQKEIEEENIEEETLDEEKDPEEQLAMAMVKILKTHAKKYAVSNLRTVVHSMLDKV